MAVIVMNWELGSDMGHVSRYVALGEAFQRLGHRPVMVLRDLARAHEIAGASGIEYFQAPLWQTPVRGLPEPLNVSEMLFYDGFLRAASLIAITRAWRNLWRAIGPDLLLFDHSPTALLAARGLPQPKVLVGNSFAVPALGKPMPCFRWWEKNSNVMARLVEGESRLVRTMNETLVELGEAPLERVSQLYDADRALILCRPELDCYGARDMPAGAAYRPPLNNLELGVEPRWPLGNGPKVFAYVKTGFRHLEPLLAACQKSDARFLFFVPGIAEQVRRRYESSNLAFSAEPLKMSRVREECDFAISHAGGMTDIMLEAGKPILLLPLYMEQTMTCRQAEQTGAALGFGVDRNPADLPKLLRRLLSDVSLQEAARAYAGRYASEAGEDPAAAIAKECLSLL